MTPRDPELERLTSLLGKCLGRIDAQTHRILGLEDEDGDGDYETAEQLEDETSRLQDLIGELLSATSAAEQVTDVNRVVAHVASTCLQELTTPIVLRQLLAPGLPKIACATPLVTVAVQRALVLALSRVGPGDEVRITTREEGGSVLVEIESQGSGEGSAVWHAETLRDFVDELGGRCHVDLDQRQNLLLAIELPQVLSASDRESA